MLVSLKEILSYAEEKNCAIGAFNTPNLENINAVLDAAEELCSPVILSHAEVHEAVSPMRTIGTVMVTLAEKAKIPVCVHLDHCEHLDYMKKALDLGFSGVMYDGSVLPYEENLENTVRAVELAAEYGAGVEAEIGRLAAREGEGSSAGPVYTEPSTAKAFAEASGIDALAPSFGTCHGIYRAKPQLQIELVEKIRAVTGLPLVMHGGSGVYEEDYRRSIKAGIRKINYYSYMAKAGTAAVENSLSSKEIIFFHDLALAAQKAMKADCTKALRVFMGS